MAAACDRLADRFTELTRRISRHSDAVADARSESGSRAEAETAAATDWTVWPTAVAELVALQATVGGSAAEVRRQLEAAEVEAGQVGRAVKAAHSARAANPSGRDHATDAPACLGRSEAPWPVRAAETPRPRA